MNIEVLKNEIYKLKEEKNALIVAHNYQIDEVQEIADFVGDSFYLSKVCAERPEKVIVFCGVHFMAESAKILSPHKKVLLPEIDAGCPLADMVTAEDVENLKKKYPDYSIVCYINSPASVKAKSDVICTSSNAVKIVREFPNDKIIFLPDKNLGSFVKKQVPEKDIILWEGFCITHYKIKKEDVEKAKSLHPNALVLVHPECRPEVVELADFVGSTKQIIDFANTSKEKEFIIGTEMGVLYSLKKLNPDKKFYILHPGMICPNMKKNTLQSVRDALLYERYQIEVEEEIMEGAKKALSKMLEMG
ncbi:quinolinate synthetase [Caldicellulosiruptor bescii]|uniref:Quinolinate synthase n=2 Tax=Caldicellulosiruptor bescii TaxID=31899 RepID=NADA_CALBD|nr:quinolinate synthase NadA [Caldicellulosiruptor bescii]B9MRK8.1 RecName: Full=Quinolinate synthase [Caldicellulosiruptor bescii DSM 6725]ACM60312.1 quinolinate synthetase complex, A subunit [Caldicellulosiruptor bescii DSM 6725]PBC87726.1 quinolinate synthetase [Caldicellulosiruptor bescii]PBC90659.1 quinolinate synthetase [Caldicellulosiruptor bescii]PBD03909.1 quinolinate synthetase [Caldicellulosiruptor bescii]PBD06456.1 quinolinate synthetase [Caldicellulosiruptor bescii]